jgi:hypothetical protein
VRTARRKEEDRRDDAEAFNKNQLERRAPWRETQVHTGVVMQAVIVLSSDDEE